MTEHDERGNRDAAQEPEASGAPPRGQRSAERVVAEERSGGRSLVFPMVLIGVGVLLLLQTLGVIEASVWASLWQLWPVALILIGLDLLVGQRSRAGRWIVAVVALAVVLGAAAYLAAGGGVGATRIEEIDEPVAGADSAEVRISHGIGSLELVGADSDALVSGEVELPEGADLVLERSDRDRGVLLALAVDEDGPLPFRIGPTGDLAWDLAVSDRIPLDLRIDTGVGEATIDLTGVQLERLDLDTGVGETEITLPATGAFQVDVDGGIGEVHVRVPEGLEVRLTADTGIGGLDIEGDWDEVDGAWRTSGFEDADARVEVRIDTGVGEVTVEQVD